MYHKNLSQTYICIMLKKNNNILHQYTVHKLSNIILFVQYLRKQKLAGVIVIVW